jgi:imidazolonepropionase-like amidohydrolase
MSEDETFPADEWVVADAVWWAPGSLAGPAGLLLRGGFATGEPPVAVADIPEGATIRRLPGALLPGLCDAHVHSALVEMRTVRTGGIAAAWDLGGAPAEVAALRARADDPTSGLPRMAFAGAFLTAPGGYPSDRSWAPPGSWREVRSADDAEAAVGESRAAGATIVKITANASGPLLPEPVLRAAVDAAHAAGMPVVVHAEGPGTVASAFAAGADLLAHTPWTEPLDDGLIRAMAARMTWISTLDIHGWGTPTPERETAVDNLRQFLEYGGQVRYGTDLGNGPLPPGVNPREIRALQDVGLSPELVLAAMTHDRAGAPPCWIPGGLDLDPGRFAGTISAARVIGPDS